MKLKRSRILLMAVAMALLLLPAGMVTVRADEYVGTLCDLQNDLSLGGDVVLTKDYTADSAADAGLDNGISVPSTVSSLELLGHTIRSMGRLFNVNGTLTMRDSSQGETGSIIGGDAYGNGGGVNVNSGSFTLDSGTITGFTAWGNGGGVYVGSDASFTMTGGAITGNTTKGFGGGVFVHDGGSFTMTGGSITENIADGNGGGVYVDDGGSFTMTGGSITGNTEDGYDGITFVGDSGVYVHSAGRFSLSGAPNIGGEVYLGGSSVITITGALTNTDPIPVIMETPGVFAKADSDYNGGRLTASDAAKFTSGESGYTVILNDDGEAELVLLTWADLQVALMNKSNVKLTTDIAAGSDDASLEVPEGVTTALDLNGCTIDGSALGTLSTLNVTGALTLTDSSGGGTISSGNYGTAVSVNNGGRLKMTGGTVSCRDNGNAVVVIGSFNMSGGTVTGGSGSYGVFVNGGTFNLSGAPAIGGEVYLCGSSVITVTGALTNTDPIPVNMQTPGVFTSGLSGKGGAANFVSSREDFGLRGKDGEAELYKLYSIIETGASSGGSVSACVNDQIVNQAGENDTVTITVEPDEGWELAENGLTAFWGADNTALDLSFNEDEGTWSFTMPAGEVSVSAAFKKQMFTVTWQDDAGNTIDTSTVEYDQTPTHEDVTKEATAAYTYAFAGWRDGTETYSPGEALPAVTENVTYTAVFTETPNAFTITYVLNDDEANPAINPSDSWTVTAQVDSADEITDIKFTSDNYNWTIMTWDEGQNAYSLTLDAAPSALRFVAIGYVYDEEMDDYDNCEYYHDANFLEPGQGAVYLNPSGSAEASPIYLAYNCVHTPGNPTGYTFGSGEIPIAAPTRTGHTFTGWYVNDDLTGDPVTAIPADSTGNWTLYAGWEKEQHTISFNTVGGTAIPPITQAFGTAVTPPANPTQDGLTFTRWDPEVPPTMPAEDITCTARWVATDYSITYDLNGATMDSAGYTVTVNPSDSDVSEVIWDDTWMDWGDGNVFTAVLPEAPASNVPVVVGILIEDPEYGYVGDISYSGTVPAELFLTGGTVTLTNEDDEDDTVEFTFATTPGGWTNPTTYTIYSSDITLAAPARPGHTFTGWTWKGQTEPVMEVTIPNGSIGDRAYTANWAVTEWAGLKADLAEGGNVPLCCDLTASSDDEPLEVPEGVTAVLDLNGCTIDASALKYNYALDVYGELTITDSSADKTGKLTRAGGNDVMGVVGVKSVGSLTLNGGEIAGSKIKITVNVMGSNGGNTYGTFTMTGGTVSGSELEYAAVFVNGGFTMSGGAVTGGGRYSGVYAWTDVFTITGKPVITEGVYLDEDTVLTIGGALDPDTKLSVRTAVTPTPDSPVVITGGLAGKGSIASFLSADGFKPETNAAGEVQLMMYMVDVQSEGTGTMEPSTQWARAGDTVTLTSTPNAGCVMMRVSAACIDGDGQQQTVALTQGTGADANKWRFTMPAQDVTVSAVFAAIPPFGTPTFVLPASTRAIEESAFEGVTGMTVVEIPDVCQSIGKWAFKNCTGLARIRIPSSVTAIDDTAFDGCENVFVYGASPSAAETFCAAHANCTFVAENAGA